MSHQAVYKYQVPVDVPAAFSVPEGAKVVHVAVQGEEVLDVVTLWALVPHPPERFGLRFFQVYGTGQRVPEKARYLGTVLVAQGSLVWHLFEVTDAIG